MCVCVRDVYFVCEAFTCEQTQQGASDEGADLQQPARRDGLARPDDGLAARLAV